MKLLLNSLLVGFMVLGMSFGCDRRHDTDTPITQTVEQTIKVGGSFTQALPGDADDVYAISTAALHAASSAVDAHTYSYTAAAGYIGDDQIILTATEQHGGGHHRCGGGHYNETEAVVTINVHIVADTTTTTTKRVGG